MKSRIINDKLMTRIKKPKNIIICPLHNLMVDKTYYEPKMLQSSYKLTWNKVQSYFYDQLQQDQIPMHFYSEYLEEDYVFFGYECDVEEC